MHLFKVDTFEHTTPLEDVLRAISMSSLDDRWRLAINSRVRVEDIKKNKSYWYMDFVKRRYLGPGKVGDSTAIEGFDFEDDESFGEETAALYDPRSNYMAIQYNHYGARSSTISAYLSKFIDNEDLGYDLLVKLRSDAEKRLAKKEIIRKLDIGVDLSKLINYNKESGISLWKTIQQAAKPVEAAEVNIVLRAPANDRRKGLSFRNIMDSLSFFRSLAEADSSPVKSLSIVGKDSEDSPQEPIDFLREKLFYEEKTPKANQDLRIPAEVRYQFLERGYVARKSEI